MWLWCDNDSPPKPIFQHDNSNHQHITTKKNGHLLRQKSQNQEKMDPQHRELVKYIRETWKCVKKEYESQGSPSQCLAAGQVPSFRRPSVKSIYLLLHHFTISLLEQEIFPLLFLLSLSWSVVIRSLSSCDGSLFISLVFPGFFVHSSLVFLSLFHYPCWLFRGLRAFRSGSLLG
jgi:hypothetical protein